MKTDVWMPIYIADYLADTMHLNTTEHGAYLLLLMSYWRNKGPLELNDERLARIVKLNLQEWLSIKNTIFEFFKESDGFLIHKRVDSEIEKTNARSNKAKQNGLTGAKEKWGQETINNKRTRSERLANARLLARHSSEEWQALTEIFPNCLRCNCSDKKIVKDHIKPIYQGGSDGIENIQPICNSCNSSKGPENVDYRPANWRELLAKRMANAWQMHGSSQSHSHSHPHSHPQAQSSAPSKKELKSKEQSRATRFDQQEFARGLIQAWENFCIEERPDLEPIAVYAQFGDYWRGIPGAKGTKLDWFATWRNWVRNQKQGFKKGLNNGKPKTNFDKNIDTIGNWLLKNSADQTDDGSGHGHPDHLLPEPVVVREPD